MFQLPNLFDATPEELSNAMVKHHMGPDQTQQQAEISALVTFNAILYVGVLPGYKSQIQKARSYLVKKLFE